MQGYFLRRYSRVARRHNQAAETEETPLRIFYRLQDSFRGRRAYAPPCIPCINHEYVRASKALDLDRLKFGIPVSYVAFHIQAIVICPR